MRNRERGGERDRERERERETERETETERESAKENSGTKTSSILVTHSLILSLPFPLSSLSLPALYNHSSDQMTVARRTAETLLSDALKQRGIDSVHKCNIHWFHVISLHAYSLMSDVFQTNNGLSQRQLTDGVKLLELQRRSQIQVGVVFLVLCQFIARSVCHFVRVLLVRIRLTTTLWSIETGTVRVCVLLMLTSIASLEGTRGRERGKEKYSQLDGTWERERERGEKEPKECLPHRQLIICHLFGQL